MKPDSGKLRLFEEMARVETTALSLVTGAGYRRVYLPSVAPLAAYGNRLGDEVRTEYITFPLGGEQVLRPEFTTAVCRLVLEQGVRGGGLARLAYVGQVFRANRGADLLPHEVRQLGVECIGGQGEEADVELTSLLARAADALGGEGWRLTLGHTELPSATLAALGVDSATVDGVIRDLHRLRSHGERLRGGDRILRDVLPRFLAARAQRAGTTIEELEGADADHGDPRALEQLEWAVTEAQWRRAGVPDAAIELLRQVDAPLPDAVQDASKALVTPLRELAETVSSSDGTTGPLTVDVDPLLTPELPYYSGLLLRLTGPGGALLGTGGRYDRLMTLLSNGAAAPGGIGFALDVERVARLAINGSAVAESKDRLSA